MSREVIVKAYCDPCQMLLDQRTEAVLEVIAVINGLGRKIDVCAEHDAAIIAPLHQLLKVQGRPLDEKPPAGVTLRRRRTRAQIEAAEAATADTLFDDNELQCPGCDLESQSRNALLHHIYREHLPRPELEPCPTCGVTAKNTAGMATHRRAVHQFDALADAKMRIRLALRAAA